MFSHSEIVEIAYKWLLKNGGVGFAFKELHSIAREIPDVIGFDGWQSILIEVKVSRSDFLCDLKKSHRQKGMGNWRFYCCPKGLIKTEELPPKWGLIYVNEKGKARVEYDCRYKKIESPYSPSGWRVTSDGDNFFDCDMLEERRMMYSALRRLHLRKRIDEIYPAKEQANENN